MKENYYFDNAATSWPKPEPVYEFMDAFFRSHGVNPGRSGHQLAVEAEILIIQTRQMLAQFFCFGGDPNRVVFSQNATDSMNTALFGLTNPGDHMIITRLEHNAVLRPANHLERDRGVSVSRVRRNESGYIDPDDIRRELRSDTRVVVVNHGSNVLGSVQELKAIGDIVRQTDAAFVVDTCQTAGVLPIDMDDWGIDVLVFTGHKGLLGPMGIGGMIVRDGIEIPPSRVGGTGYDSILPYHPDVYPLRLEAGTPSIPGIAGLHAAQKWFAELGRKQLQDPFGRDASHQDLCRMALEHIASVENDHVARLVRAFEELENVVVYGPQDNRPRAATLSINVEGMPADEAGTILDADHSVCVRAGLHCAPLVHEDEGTVERKGTIRFSPGFLTDDEDIGQAVEAVTALNTFGKSVRAKSNSTSN